MSLKGLVSFVLYGKLETYLNESCFIGIQPGPTVNLAHEGFMCLSAGTHDAHTPTVTV